MAELNLSEGAIGDDGAAHLAACLPHIRELKLKFCNITAVGVESLTNAIAQKSVSKTALFVNYLLTRSYSCDRNALRVER